MKYIFTLWKGWSRFIRSHKLQSATCIIGLSLGMACYALSMLWMHHLESFEDFVPDCDRIYLMGNKQSDYNGTARYNSEGYFAQYLIENYPEVVASARFSHRSFKRAIGAGEPYNTQVEEATCWQVEPEFLDLFGFKAIEGSTNFLDAHDVVITLEMAKRLFGKDSAVGKKISFRNIGESSGITKTVIGVIENWPENSQFRGDIFARCSPTKSIGGFGHDFRWGAIFKVREGTDPKALEKKIHDNVSKLSYEIAQFAPHMLPLRKLRSHYPSESTDVNLKFVRMFMILGLLVIIASLCNFVIALINNMHLRSRNMMLHRLMGASTWRIIVLNTLDTLLLFTMSAIIGLIIISLFLPTFREYSQIYMPASTILADICIYLSIVTLAGIVISAITTCIVVRGDNRTLLRGHQSHRSSSGLDRISMVVQFAMGIGMIICTLVMMLQINYLTRTNALGFSRENIIAIGHCTPDIEQKILTSPDIESHVSRCPTVFPLMVILEESLFSNKADVGIDSLSQSFYRFTYTPEMLKFWNMELKEGVLPKPETDEVLVNEAAARALGLDNPIGKEIYVVHPYIMTNTDISTYKITGLVADVYTAPPTQEPNRAIYLIADRMEEQRSIYFYEDYFLSVKARAGRKQALIDSITSWVDAEKKIYQGSHEDLSDMWVQTTAYPIDVEKEYNLMINSEMLLARLLRIIAACCIAVCLIGAYSTLSLSLQERRKEIALRKIHGAKPRRIVGMFMRSYAISLAIATIIATPIAMIIMMRWLNGYIKHIAFPYWLIIAVPVAMMAMIAATIWHRVRKAAKENPAYSLKTE